MALPTISVVISLHPTESAEIVTKATFELLNVDEELDSYETVFTLPVATGRAWKFANDNDLEVAYSAFVQTMNRIADNLDAARVGYKSLADEAPAIGWAID